MFLCFGMIYYLYLKHSTGLTPPSQMETPIVEFTDVFRDTLGSDSDVVNKVNPLTEQKFEVDASGQFS